MALFAAGTTSQGTSGIMQGGTPGAFPQSVPAGDDDPATRALHVPPPTLRWTRPNGSVLVSSPFNEYEPTGAASAPAGATNSAATASAGTIPVSTLNAWRAPTATLAMPTLSGELGTRTSIR